MIEIHALLQTASVAVQSPGADATEVVPYLTSAALIVYAQRWLKTRSWFMKLVEAIPAANKWVHRAVAAIGAVIVALGIHVTFTGSIVTGGEFHGTYPSLVAMLHAGWDWTKVFVLQQLTYDATKSKDDATVQSMAAQIKQLLEAKG